MQNIVTNRLTLTFIIPLCVILILSLLYAQDGQCDDGSLRESYSEPSVNNIPRRVFFGDLHLHTNNSADACGKGKFIVELSKYAVSMPL